MPPPLTAMRAQAATVINDWAATCDVTRFNPSTDTSGRKTGSYSAVSGGSNVDIWIQPIAGNSDIRGQGLNSETTHLAFQEWAGVALVPKDRIDDGSDFVYDVIAAHVLESHRMSELKQVRRV